MKKNTKITAFMISILFGLLICSSINVYAAEILDNDVVQENIEPRNKELQEIEIITENSKITEDKNSNAENTNQDAKNTVLVDEKEYNIESNLEQKSEIEEDVTFKEDNITDAVEDGTNKSGTEIIEEKIENEKDEIEGTKNSELEQKLENEENTINEENNITDNIEESINNNDTEIVAEGTDNKEPGTNNKEAGTEKSTEVQEEVDDSNEGINHEDTNHEDNNSGLPDKYNLAEHCNILVENQGSEGNCWTFASIETLETYLQLHGYGTFDFSENHLNYLESNYFEEYRNVNTGGTYQNFLDYLEKEYGPVSEKEFPYFYPGTSKHVDYEKDELDALLDIIPLAYLGEKIEFPMIDKLYKEYTDEQLSEFRNSVKQHIMENGALYTSIVAPTYYEFTYYNPYTYAAYFDKEDPDFSEHSHAVAIIGWDDNFSKDNFVGDNKPKHNGAYIALNSWGRDFGNDGLYYISYDDIFVEQYLSGIKEAATEPIKNKENVTFTFKDKNLYNALKEKLKKKVIDFNDDEQNLTFLDSEVVNIDGIELNNSEISDLSGIENFNNLMSINLSNNNISTVEPLKSLNKLVDVNLAKNKLNEVPEELKDCKLETLILDYNPIEDFSNLRKFPSCSVLYLEGTNFEDKDLKYIEDMEVYTLNLSKTKTKDYSFLKTKEGTISELNISYNKDIIYESIPNFSTLKLSHTDTTDEKFKQIKDFSALTYVDLSYTNIHDLSIIPAQIGIVIISGNKNLINFDYLNNADSIEYTDVELEDVSIFKDSKASRLLLQNNNLSDITDLLNNPNLYYLNVSNNKLTSLYTDGRIIIKADNNYLKPNLYSYTGIDTMKEQNYTETLKVDTRRKNNFEDLGYKLADFESNGYELVFTNAIVDLEKGIFEVADYNKDVIVKILNNIFDGSVITYKVEKIDNSKIDYIYLDNNSEKKYIEGDDFDLSTVKMIAVYDNESTCKVEDYEVIGDKSLQKGNQEITFKTGDISTSLNVDVIPKDEVATLTFEEEDIYKGVLEKIKQLEDERRENIDFYNRLDILIRKDDKNKTIKIYKDDLSDLSYIEIKSDKNVSLQDLKQLPYLSGIGIDGKQFDYKDFLNGIIKLMEARDADELVSLTIKNNELIKSINENKFRTLSIENSKVEKLGNLTNLKAFKYIGNIIVPIEHLLDTLKMVDVTVTTTMDEVNKDKDNNIILPDILNYFKNNGFIVKAKFIDQVRDEKYLYPYIITEEQISEKDGNLFFENEQIKKLYKEGQNQVIEFSVLDPEKYFANLVYKYIVQYTINNKEEEPEIIDPVKQDIIEEEPKIIEPVKQDTIGGEESEIIEPVKQDIIEKEESIVESAETNRVISSIVTNL